MLPLALADACGELSCKQPTDRSEGERAGGRLRYSKGGKGKAVAAPWRAGGGASRKCRARLGSIEAPMTI